MKKTSMPVGEMLRSIGDQFHDAARGCLAERRYGATLLLNAVYAAAYGTGDLADKLLLLKAEEKKAGE